MSVINSMLRDLDRRHAPLPEKANVQPTLAQKNRALPRSAVALCALIIVAMWSWNHHMQQKISLTAKPTLDVQNKIVPANSRSTSAFATTRRESLPGGSEAASMPPTVAANTEVERPASVPTPNTEPKLDRKIKESSANNSVPINSEKSSVIPEPMNQSNLREEDKKAQTAKTSVAVEQPAPIIKQDRINPNALNDERYQLARAALAQNQPQRAYELLRDNPPPVASATDYHAVLAAVEQQLGHYADASLRYQQLLTLDQNQASWWLGFALSLEGEHRNRDALAAYQRAAQLNSLPDAARQYADTRIAALSASAEH